MKRMVVQLGPAYSMKSCFKLLPGRMVTSLGIGGDRRENGTYLAVNIKRNLNIGKLFKQKEGALVVVQVCLSSGW